MGFGPFSSESSSSDNRQVAGDASILARGNNNSVAQPGSTLLDLKNAKLSLAPVVSGNKGNVVINDTAPLQNLAAQFADTIKSVATGSSAALAGALQQQSATVQDALGKVADLSTSGQSSGDSSRNKIVLYVVLAALTLLGVVFYFRKL